MMIDAVMSGRLGLIFVDSSLLKRSVVWSPLAAPLNWSPASRIEPVLFAVGGVFCSHSSVGLGMFNTVVHLVFYAVIWFVAGWPLLFSATLFVRAAKWAAHVVETHRRPERVLICYRFSTSDDLFLSRMRISCQSYLTVFLGSGAVLAAFFAVSSSCADFI